MSDPETRMRRQRDEDKKRKEREPPKEWHRQRTPFKPRPRRERTGDEE